MKVVLALVLICVSLLAGCARETEYEGARLSRFDGSTSGPYGYSIVGHLDFDGQNPSVKAEKIMHAACPQGLPTLMDAQASRIQTATSNQTILIGFFTCNQLIPGVE
jgi:hypothetical protein